MTGIESLDRIRDESARENILQIADSFVAAVHPLQIILFGSFADGTYTDESDYDFYLVIDDGASLHDTCSRAHQAVSEVKERPVDIVIGHHSYFEQKGRMENTLTVEGEVHRGGILLYRESEERGQSQ